MAFNGETYESVVDVYAAVFSLAEAPDRIAVYDTVAQPYDSDAIDVKLDDDEVLVHEAYYRRGEGRYVARPRQQIVDLTP